MGYYKASGYMWQKELLCLFELVVLDKKIIDVLCVLRYWNKESPSLQLYARTKKVRKEKQLKDTGYQESKMNEFNSLLNTRLTQTLESFFIDMKVIVQVIQVKRSELGPCGVRHQIVDDGPAVRSQRVTGQHT